MGHLSYNYSICDHHMRPLIQYKIHFKKVNEKYTKDLEVLNAELDKVSKEIKKKIEEREEVAEEAKR